MLVPEFFTNFSNGTLSKDKFHCEQTKVTEGLETLTEAYYTLSVKTSRQDAILKLFHQHDEYFLGYNQTSKKEDNMFYDLNFDYDGVDSDRVEEEFRNFMENFTTEVGKLKRQIENCQDLVDKYDKGIYSGKEVEEILNQINDYYLNVPLPIESEGEVNKASGGASKARGSYGSLPKAITRSEEVEVTTETPQVENVKEPELKDKQVMKSSTDISNKNNVNPAEVKQSTKTSSVDDKKKAGQLVSSVGSKNVKNDFTNSNSVPKTSSNNKINSVLDLISNGDKKEEITDKVESEVKKAAGKLTSSIANLKNFNSRTVIPKMVDKSKDGGGSFVPPIAGLSAAVVAGLGTKLYVDKEEKEDEEKQEEKNEENKDNENNSNEDDLKLSSKEDILNYLDR